MHGKSGGSGIFGGQIWIWIIIIVAIFLIFCRRESGKSNICTR